MYTLFALSLLATAPALAEEPSRIRGELSGGWMPPPYVDAINGGLTSFDVYSDTVADIIDAVLEDALVGRLEVGYRPWPDRGFTVSAGYQHIRVFGNTADLTYFAEGVDEDDLATVQEFTGDLLVNAGVHQAVGEVGYERAIRGPWRVNATLGFAYTFQANSTVETTRDPTNPPQETAQQVVTTGASSYLDYVFEEWVHLPMAGVSAGYRF